MIASAMEHITHIAQRSEILHGAACYIVVQPTMETSGLSVSSVGVPP